MREYKGVKGISQVFGSKSKAQEIFLLLHDAKEVVRHGFYGNEIPKVEEFCKNNSIYFIKSRFKVILADKNEEYSNKGVRIPEDDPRHGMHFVYLSKDEKKAHLASYYELAGNDCELGLSMGYPPCCVVYFCNNFSEENYNPEIRSDNPYTNISKRKQDCVLISHFPCSADCEKSISLGKRYLGVIAKHDKERAEEIFAVLNFRQKPYSQKDL